MRLPSNLTLSPEERLTLLALVRQAVSQAVSLLGFPDLPPLAGRLAEPGGAFVTLRCGGKMRGCVGRVDGVNALAENVVQSAIIAALRDPRFKPIRLAELSGLEIEISVLSEPQPIDAQEIEIGTHGIVVQRGPQRALLLPQVAIERNWSGVQFLEAACRKAGLKADAWCEPETGLFAFTAEVFSGTGLMSLIPAVESISTSALP